MFVAEIAILVGGVQAGWGLAAGVAATVLALAVAALLFHAMRISVGSEGVAGHRAGAPEPEPPIAIGRQALVLALPLAVVVAIGLWTPTPLSAAFEQVASILGGGRG